MAASEKKFSALTEDYVALKDRGQQLFDGLRDLPQYGKRLWEPYFRRTFDVYNKLWKFQQEHRSTLEAEYGLQRHEIGEIASRIGQLYYQFYLRKGDTCYLDEAYVFYEAIRTRKYLGSSAPGTALDSAVVHRQLRYFTRFCVVCVLTGRNGLLLELLKELEELVAHSQAALTAAERSEWSTVLREFRAFTQVLQPLAVMHVPPQSAGGIDAGSAMVPVEVERRLRLELTEPQAELLRVSPVMAPVEKVSLCEVVLVGTVAGQPKFHELPLDVFRMLQALEWQPSAVPGTQQQQQQQAAVAGAPPSPLVNPHKYVLHRATAAQLSLVLATAMVEMPPGGALLLYLSASGVATTAAAAAAAAAGGGGGGAAASADSPDGLWKQGGVALSPNADSQAARHACCLRAADLWPFCRVPLFLVVESDNAGAFRALPAAAAVVSGAPLLCLLAPRSWLQLGGGGLLTLFLHEPLAAFALLGGVTQTPQATHRKLDDMLLTSFTRMTRALLACPETPQACLAFLCDPFLRMLLLRFVFCHATLTLFKPPKGGTLELPTSVPALPDAVLRHENTLGIVRQLAATLGIIGQFHATPPLEVVGSSAKSSAA